MSYNSVFCALGAFALVFLYEIDCARESNAADIFVKLLFGHTDTVVADGQRAGIFIKRYGDAIVIVGSLAYSERFKSLELCYGVGSVRNYLAKENILLGIKPLFYNREYMLCINGDTALFYVFVFFSHFCILSKESKISFHILKSSLIF